MNGRIFFAILCGAMIGGAFVYAMAGQAGWYLLGVPLGGAIAWLIYAWRDIAREAPRVWASISSWRPHTEKLIALCVYFLSVMMVAASVTASLVTIILAIRMTFSNPLMIDWFHLTLMIFCFAFIGFLPDSLESYQERRKRRVSSAGIRFVAKRKRQLIFPLSPIGVTIMLFEAITYLPRAVRVISLFLTRLFVRVHSHDALDCFLYAATGVLIGSLLTQSIWVMIVSAAIGIALAFTGRSLARWLKTQWPTLAT